MNETTNGHAPATLEIQGLEVSVENKPILRGIDLVVRQGETHAMMGPNGSGKSTLANVLMGRPGYVITAGKVRFKGEDITSLTADQRAQRGLFLAMQYPVEIPGVSVVNFLRTAYKNVKGEEINALAFRKHLKEKMNLLGVEDSMVQRYVNQGFSGGEKKKNEVLQLAVLEPEIAVLDETDSGLDIDSLKSVAQGVAQLIGPDLGVLLITHYQRILNYISPDRVHVMMNGRIVKSGGLELAQGHAGLGAEANRGKPGCYGHTRAAAGSARTLGEIVRVEDLAADGAETHRGLGHFIHVGLDEDDRAGLAQPLNHRGIARRVTVREHRVAARGRHADGVDVVLDGDRNAVQKAAAASCLALLIELARDLGGARVDREHGAEARTLFVVGLDALQVQTDEPLVGQHAGVHGGVDVGDAGGEEIERARLGARILRGKKNGGDEEKGGYEAA